MPRRRRIHVPGGFYHVTLRGNHRQPVFHRDADRALLNKIVARALEKFGARLHAYCWMTNHLHFLLQVGTEPLSRLMRQVASEFARAMQITLATTGHFFERRHHATLIEATDYLFTVLHYIHHNPVAAGLVTTPGAYRWSSHHAYTGRRSEPWVTTDFLLGRFSPQRAEAVRRYSAFIARASDERESAFPEGACIFGSDAFIEQVRGVSAQVRAGQRLEELIREACEIFAVQRERLHSSVRDRELSRVRAWVAQRAAERGIANRSQVARALGRSEGALRHVIRVYGGSPGQAGCE